MVLFDWKTKYEDWEGNAAEFAIVASDLMRQLGLPTESPEGVEPNERLVRDYTRRGILDRPKRVPSRPKEAIYGLEQLEQFLAARSLLKDGLSFSKVQELMKASDKVYVSALIPDGGTKTPAQEVVARLRKADRTPESKPVKSRMLRIELEPWCHVYVDLEELKRMPGNKPDLLGKTLALELRAERKTRGDKK